MLFFLADDDLTCFSVGFSFEGGEEGFLVF